MKQVLLNFLKRFFGEKNYYSFKNRLRKLKWRLNKPKYPLLEGNIRNIHLGCGKVNHPEFINVDLALYPHIHHLADVEKLPMFRDDFADLIYVSHCLEHIPHPKLLDVLKEWLRVLKIGGILRISVPDFDTIVEIYNETEKDLTEIQGPLMGGHDSKENIHGVALNHKFLKEQLIKAGFAKVRKWNYGSDKYSSFDDWSGKEVKINNKEYFISLNLEAEK